MNLPNKLTLLRIVLSLFFIVFLLTPGFPAKLLAAIIFATASFTDWLDGWLARRWKLVTDFGILMDPIADKILVLSAFIAFVQLNIAPAWMVVLIATREFLITGLRIFALGRGHLLPAEAAGKHKTVSQIVAISCTLLFLLLRESTRNKADHFQWILALQGWIWWLMLLTVILTLTSGISFFWRHRKIILSL